MKIFHSSDLHFNKKQFEWIKSQEDQFDIIAITGDLLCEKSETPVKEQIKYVLEWIDSFTTPIAVCSGNHDIESDMDWVDSFDNKMIIVNPNSSGDGLRYELRFCTVPFIGADLSSLYSCDILLSHLPPSSVDTAVHRETGEDWGDSELLEKLKKWSGCGPKMILSGHIHHPVSTYSDIEGVEIYNLEVNRKAVIPSFNLIKIPDFEP